MAGKYQGRDPGQLYYPQDIDTSSWTRLKTQILNAGYTATQVSDKAKVPWVRLSGACVGRRQLRPEEYQRIADLLSLHPSELLGWNNPECAPSIESRDQQNKRLKLERDAMARLRIANPTLYNHLVYGEQVDDITGETTGEAAGREVSNGSRG